MAFAVTDEIVLQAAVANGADLTGIAYPTGTNQAAFQGIYTPVAANHVAVLNRNDVIPGAQLTVTFGASTITVTNGTGVSWPIGTRVSFQFDRAAYPLLVDNSGGTAAQTLAAISGSYTQSEVRNSIATLAAAINQLAAYVRATVGSRNV